jgi:predicted nucleic acid-binding protein
MSGFLLDTNVLSEFNRRGEPDRLVKQWLEAAVATVTAFLTVGLWPNRPSDQLQFTTRLREEPPVRNALTVATA